MPGTSFWNVEFINQETKELFMESGITKLQAFYGLSYDELFDEEAMISKGVKKEELEYIKENRETELSRKEKESWEIRKDLLTNPEWRRLKEFYGLNDLDVRDVKILEAKWLSKKDIAFVTGRKEEEPVKESITKKQNGKK